MAINETFQRKIIDGKEVMVCIERTEVPDPPAPDPTPEEKIKALQDELAVLKADVAKLKAGK